MNRRESILTSVFLYSAGAVLFLTATAKVFSAFGKARILQNPDVVLHISHQKVFLLAAALEFVVAGMCWGAKSSTLSTGAVAWLSTLFLMYRVNQSSYGPTEGCGCLGTLTEALHISPATADSIMRYLLGYLLIGSYIILIRRWRSKVSTGRQQVNASAV